MKGTLLVVIAVACAAALAWWSTGAPEPGALRPTTTLEPVQYGKSAPSPDEPRVAFGREEAETVAERPSSRPQHAIAVHLSGRVTHAHGGSPIAGATVRVHESGAEATTSETGHYALAFDLSDRAVWLSADHEDYTAANHQLQNSCVPPGGATTVDFELAPASSAATLRGRFLEPNGRSVPGVEVLLSPIQTARLDTARARPFLTVESSADGHFVIAEIPAGTHTLFALPDEHRDYQRLGIELPAGSTSDLGTIELQPFPWASLEGKVQTAAGVPKHNVLVEVSQGLTRLTAHTDVRGNYRIERIRPGSWHVSFTEPNVYLRVDPVEFPDGADLRRDLLLPSGAHFVGGQVLVAGEPAAGFEVSCEPTVPDSPASWESWIATTDHQGRFRIDNLAGGPVRLSFTREVPWLLYDSDDVQIDRDDHRFDFDTHRRPVTITGTVRSMDGAPVAGAAVAPAVPLTLDGRAVSATDGGYRVDVQATTDASFSLHARHPGYLPQTLVLTWRAANGEGVIEADFVLQGEWNTGTVSGTITDTQGHRISQVSVLGQGEDGGLWSCQSDSHGFYRLSHVSAGELRLQFRHRGYQPLQATHQLAAGQDLAVDVQLDLLDRFSRTVQVFDSAGAPLPGVEVETWHPNGAYISGGRTDERGVAAVDGLPQGPVDITVDAAGHLRHKLVHDVDGPMTTPLPLRLTSGAGTIRGRALEKDGTPLASTEVSLASTIDNPVGIDHFVLTDLEGRFLFNGLPPGEYELAIWTLVGQDSRTARTDGPEVQLQIR